MLNSIKGIHLRLLTYAHFGSTYTKNWNDTEKMSVPKDDTHIHEALKKNSILKLSKI